jgi:hypothetical protein
MNEKKVINLMQFKQAEKIGSSAIKELTYSSDIDLQEIIYTNESYNDILHKFQNKFKQAKADKNLYIMDFKCGVLAGNYPIRWNYDTIMQGYQFLNGQKKLFITCLQQESIIKMDVIALIDGVYTEFSNNYYFEFPDTKTRAYLGNDISAYLLNDYYELIEENNRFKALKRVFAYYRYNNKTNEVKELIRYFNSPVGKFNHQINSLKIISEVIDNTFRPVDINAVKYNLKIVKDNVPDHYKRKLQMILELKYIGLIKIRIDELIKIMSNELNNIVAKYMINKKINIT